MREREEMAKQNGGHFSQLKETICRPRLIMKLTFLIC